MLRTEIVIDEKDGHQVAIIYDRDKRVCSYDTSDNSLLVENLVRTIYDAGRLCDD